MRRSLAKLPCHSVIGCPAAALCTSSGGGSGRGGSNFTVNESHPGKSKQDDDAAPPQGHGRYRGEALPSQAFSSPIGLGRGFTIPQPPRDEQESNNSRRPLQFLQNQQDAESGGTTGDLILTGEILNVLGAGRGKITGAPVVDRPKPENRHLRWRPQQDPRLPPMADSAAADSSGPDMIPTGEILGAGRGKITEAPDMPIPENRHHRQRPQQDPRSPPMAISAAAAESSGPKQQLTQEEKARKAIEILSKGARGVGRGDPRTSSGRGRGTRPDSRMRYDDDKNLDSYLDDATKKEMDEKIQKLAKVIGHDKMEVLDDVVEKAYDNVVPDLEDERYLDALHTNYMLECEPEYFMEEFGTNPDIDDKPIIPLREAFEKMKPFLMRYEGIRTEEEWQQVIEETMKNVPLMKKIVDDLAGPAKVTAKEQQRELEQVAKTLPARAPASVKRFTERALLSLQSNPGWKFDKKCQFMEQLVGEVSKQYKGQSRKHF